MMMRPTCARCGLVMTPANARIHPEFFLHDACLPAELRADSTGPNAPQPAPIPRRSVPIWELVQADMAERNDAGTAKYGTPLQAHNGRDALVDAYQEALDLCVYLRQAIEERINPPSPEDFQEDC